MPGDITDAYAGDKHDPALVVANGDPERRKMSHNIEKPPMLGDHDHSASIKTSEDDYDLKPTEEELRTLRHVSDKIPIKAYTIAIVELVERMSYYGCTQVYVNFIQRKNPGTPTGRALNPHDENAVPGALGYGQRASTAITTTNQFFVYLVPLFGAWVADTYLGRFKTIVYSVIIATVGHIILTASAAPSVIKHPDSGIAAFIIGMLVLGVGTGGFKPNISPLVAEQIPTTRHYVKTLKSGERVIVDPQVTISRVYNWFYFCINVGALIGQISMVYAERYVGFYLSFMIPTIAFALTLPLLAFCRKWYNLAPPEGSVLGPAVKLLMLGTKGRWHANPVATYKHMTDGTFWDSVKPSRIAAGNRPRWMQFDDAWVDEVGRGFAACKVFLWYPLYWLTYNQINNNLVSQAATMQLGGVPNDIVSNLDPFALIIFIPITDIIIYPALRRAKINFSPIKKITAGFICGSLAMVWATVIQYYIYHRSECGYYPNAGECHANLSVWAQTGSYVLIALSEIFASITSLEYAFSKAPKNMRSLVQAFALFMTAISAAIGEGFVPLSEDPLLIWNYGSMAVIAGVASVIFYFSFRSVDKKEFELNQLPQGHMQRRNDDVGDVESSVAGHPEKV